VSDFDRLYGFPALRKLSQGHSDLHGDAKWMTAADVQTAGLDDPGGVLLGQTSSGRLLRFNRDGHIMVFAPTGAGKGIGFVQANLVDYGGSMVVLDPKGENAIVSAAHRHALGHDVLILDPFGKTGLASGEYNPLGALSFADRQNLGPMIEAIADALIPTGEHKENPHWPMGAKKFLSFLLWFMVAHQPEERRHLVRLYDLAHSGYEKLEEVARIMTQGLHPDPDIARVCVALGNWFLGREEREFSYFESQAVNNLGWVGDFVWSEVLASKPTPPLPLKGRRMTVYLVLPFNRLDRYRPWLRVMVADLLNSLYDTPGAPDQPVLFMLDEAFAGLGQMESLFAAAAAVRGAGARLCFIYQDIHQVEKLYGLAWASLVANSGATLFWSVGADYKTGEFVSHCTGMRTVPVPGQPAGMGQPLIRPEQVMQLPADEIVALFRNLPPARFGRLNVRTDDRFGSRLAENTTYGAPIAAGDDVRPHVSRAFVPVDLTFGAPPKTDPAGAPNINDPDARMLEQLSQQFGHPVSRNARGEFGYRDERGYWVPISDPPQTA
jgi:type IV secretion system protein VirD4